MRRARLPVITILTLALTSSSCTTSESDVSASATTVDGTGTVTAPPTPSVPDATPTSAPAGSSPCVGLAAVTVATLDEPELTELSGLAASHRHRGVVWASNDSGDRARLFALDLRPAAEETGPGTAVVGAVEIDVDGFDPVDVEDLAAVGDDLYIADIGDNNAVRSEITVHRLAEPDPSEPATATVAETLRLRYPDGPRDAEAFIVDPVSGDLIIIDKQLTDGEGRLQLWAPPPATVFAASPPFDADTVVELEAVATIDVAALAARSVATPPPGVTGLPGLAGVVTGADIRSDGALVALRTYQTVWLFPRAEGQTVADALAHPGCEAPIIVEDQGEAVALLDPDTSRFVTIGEGLAPAVNVTGDR